MRIDIATVIMNALPARRNVRDISWTVAAILLCASTAAQAAVTLTFSGTYDEVFGTVFGVPGPTAPFSYQITYDPAIDTNTSYIPSGVLLHAYPEIPTTHEWYGYSASGITASNLTFGSKTWTPADMVPRLADFATEADLWFDTDISLFTPTRCWIHFGLSDFLELGSPGIVLMGNDTAIQDVDGGVAYAPTMTITSTVPEPAAPALAAFAAAGLARRRRRARSVRKPSADFA